MTEPTEAATHAASSAASKASNAFTRKLGPLPVWTWGLIAGGLFLGYRAYAGRGASSAKAAASSDGTQPEDLTTTATVGPAGVGGYFVPIDSFGSQPGAATTEPAPYGDQWQNTIHPILGHPAPEPPPTYPIRTPVHRWPIAPIRHVAAQATSEQELAQQFYGSSSLWRVIHNANLGSIRTPGDIPAGTAVLIPRR